MIFAFGDCEVDIARRELRRDGGTVHVEPQVFDVLVHLIKCRDRVVSKHELFQAVWRGRIVSDDTLTSRISAARRAIGDSGTKQSRLRTVARHGFRFCGDVEERPPASATQGSASGRAPKSPIPNLPSETTRLIGRAGELVEIAGLLATGRFITLAGPGGVGKTRLAMSVARAACTEYPDGVWLVELAPVTDPTAVPHTVAAALSIVQQPGATIEHSVLQALAGRRLLLVLDNCEHLIDSTAAFVQNILANCPRLSVLATSREVLAIDGERSYLVPPLSTRDGVSSPATELFLERAQAITPDFSSNGERAAVSEICQRLDGVPLAIELAAARTRTMLTSEIRDRLDEMFRLLTGGRRYAVQRHRTLHAALQWSYDLLSASEQAALNCSAVFVGGFTLQAATEICALGDELTALDLLDQLVRKSLVTVNRSEFVRYRLLEPIRQFALERLSESGQADAVHLRHARYFAADSDAHFNIWRSPNQLTAYEWLDREMGNLASAFRLSKNRGMIDLAARIASNIGDMARFRLREDTAHWAAEVVDAARAIRHRRLAVLLTWAASSAWSLGQLTEARAYAVEAISLVGDSAFDPFVWAFTDLAMVECYEGNAGRGVELVRSGTCEDADKHDRFCLAMLPHFLTVSAQSEEARQCADYVVVEVTKTGIPSSIAIALWAKGGATAESNPMTALHAYEQAMAVARQSGNRFWEVLTIPPVAALQARSGDPAAALRNFQQMLEGSSRSADLIFMSHGLARLVVLLGRLGYADAAATLYGAMSKNFDASSFVQDLPETVRSVRDRLGEAGFQAASQIGMAMALHQATDYALGRVRHALSALGAADG